MSDELHYEGIHEPLTPVAPVRKKLIVKFDADISELDALRFVFDVVEDGRVSESRHGKQFCFVTIYTAENGKVEVIADLTETGTDVFTMRKRKE